MHRKRKLLAIAFIGAAAFLTLGAEEEGCSDFEDETATVKTKEGKTTSVAGVGDKLTLKGTTYQVTKASTTQSVGDQYIGEKANGVFVLIDLNLTNRKKEPATISDTNIRLIGGNGSEYSQSTEASFVLDDPLILFEEIQPGVTQSGQLIYDIPKKALKGTKLQVEDFWSSSTGDINLDL